MSLPFRSETLPPVFCLLKLYLALLCDRPVWFGETDLDKLAPREAEVAASKAPPSLSPLPTRGIACGAPLFVFLFLKASEAPFRAAACFVRSLLEVEALGRFVGFGAYMDDGKGCRSRSLLVKVLVAQG